jgi:hypothetical protein
MLVSTFIGQLSKLTFKQNYCLVSQDKTYCDMSYNLYTEHGFNIQYINHIDCDLIVLLIQKITPNLMTATPIWNQFIEGGKICLSKMSYSLIHNTPNAIVWAVNTDSVTAQNPNESVLQEAREYPKYSSSGHSPLDSIGKLKIEDTIKIRGKQLSVVMAKQDCNSDGNLTVTPNENIFHTADGAGAGKTFKMTKDFMSKDIDTTMFLNPTHIANKNIVSKMIEIDGFKHLTLESEARAKRIHTVASIFTHGKSVKDMLDGLSKLTDVFVDEFFQLSPFHIQMLY